MQKGDQFAIFIEFQEAIRRFEKDNFVSLYVRESRSISGARGKSIKRHLRDDLKIYSATYCCYHGERSFDQTQQEFARCKVLMYDNEHIEPVLRNFV